MKLRNIVNSRLVESNKLEEYTFAHTFSTWMAIYQKLFESEEPSDCGFKSVSIDSWNIYCFNINLHIFFCVY